MTPVLLLLALLATETREEAVDDYLARDASGFQDPTDPTRFDRGVWFGAEWVSLAQGEGDLILFHVAASQPLGEEDQFRLGIDLPFGWSDTKAAGTGAGIGDLRMTFSWRPWQNPAPHGVFQAVAFEADVSVPSGSDGKSLGAGDWVIAPALTTKWRTKSISTYLTARWIWAEDVNVDGIRGYNIPGVDAFSNSESRTDVNALDLALSFAWDFDRRTSPVHWFAITPDWTTNLARGGNDMLILRTRMGRAIGAAWSFDLDFWFPIAGDRSQSFTLRFAFIWEF